MAQKTNTFATFNAVGNREELADAIYRLGPTLRFDAQAERFLDNAAADPARASLRASPRLKFSAAMRWSV